MLDQMKLSELKKACQGKIVESLGLLPLDDRNLAQCFWSLPPTTALQN
jgi:hypothetical protein